MDSSADQYQQEQHSRRYQILEITSLFKRYFLIEDQTGEDVFKVGQKNIISLKPKFVLEDMDGNGLFITQDEILHLHQTINIFSVQDGDINQKIGTLRRPKVISIREAFNINSIYGEYSLNGSHLYTKSFTVTKDGQTIANITNKSTGVYRVDIMGNENDVFILAFVTAFIKNVLDSKKAVKAAVKSSLKSH